MPACNLHRVVLVVTILAGLVVIAISAVTCGFHRPPTIPAVVPRDFSAHLDSFDLFQNTTSTFENLPPVAEKPIWTPWGKTPYDVYYGRGCKLWSMLQDGTAPSARFTSVQDLANWGWKDSLDSTDTTINKLFSDLRAPLQEQGVTLSPGNNIKVASDHTEAYGTDGEGKPTKGKYYEIYNPSQGAIVAFWNYGPGHVVGRNSSWGDAPLPELRNWSDVVFLTWLSLTAGDPDRRKQLRLVVRVNVMNKDTRDVIEEALNNEGIASGMAPAWPGYLFEPQKNGKVSKPFQAVLGTPNVGGIVWMLAQHVNELGKKTITGIRVWDKSGLDNQDAGWLPSIMVHIGPA